MRFSKMLKKAVACFLCAAMSALALSGCGKTADDQNGKKTGAIYRADKTEADYPQCLDDESGYSDMVNYVKPEKGEEIVVMTIKDKGTIKIQLFPELLPKACSNFVGLVSKGYYDGLTFHRVISEFMIQGGDPLGSGMGGESVWGSKFDGGFSKYLYHVKGALAYANSGSTSTDGSQFYIVVGSQFPQEVLDQYAGMELTETARKAYIENGGTPWLDGGYTVFGQVFEGMEIVEDICNNTETDPGDKPLDNVIIEKVEIVEY